MGVWNLSLFAELIKCKLKFMMAMEFYSQPAKVLQRYSVLAGCVIPS